MPASSSRAGSARAPPLAALSSSTSTKGAPSSTRRRKSVPHKAPARSVPASPSSTSKARVGAAVRLSPARLLKVLLASSGSPPSAMDNTRHRPSSVSPSSSSASPTGTPSAAAAHEAKKRRTGGGGLGSRDRLAAPLEGYGRGRRATSAALQGIFAAEGDDANVRRRGRSPGVGLAKRGGARMAAHPYAAAAAAAANAGEYSSMNRMARALSAGGSGGGHSAVHGVAQGAGTSPLARSFSAGGSGLVLAERGRVPNGTGVARVVELGGHVGEPYAIAA